MTSRQRFANTGKKRGSTLILFRLSRPARVVLQVKGPGPSCELAGRLPVAGKKGLNRVRFNGTVQKLVRRTVDDLTLEFVAKTRLEPGTYLLELTSRAGKRRLARTQVTIVDPESPRRRYPAPRCSSRDLEPVARSTDLSLRFGLGPLATLLSAAGVESSSGENGQAANGTESEVLGSVSPKLGQNPPQVSGVPFQATEDEGGVGLLERVLLAILLASFLALVAAAVDSLRRRRQPS